MRRINQVAVSVSAVLVLATAVVKGQTVAGDVTNTWPFGPVEDVLLDGSDLFVASGGGVLDLTTSASDPQLQSGNSQLRSGGVSSELAATTNVLYVAAAKQGVTRFARSNHLPLSGLSFLDVGDARVIDATSVSVGQQDVIFIGTNENDAGGKLCLVRALSDGTDDFTLPVSYDVHARVTALAAYRHGSGNNTLTVLVGTECRLNLQGNPEAVLRFDYDISGGAPTAVGTPVDTWSLPDASAPSGFVNGVILDIAIDAAAQKAYVAANARGVYRIDLSAGGLDDANGNGWPITKSGTSPEIFAAVDVVHTTSPSHSLLVVARNPIGVDPARQVYAVCGSPLNCDSDLLPDMVPIGLVGITLHGLDADPPQRLDLPNHVDLVHAPVKAQARTPQGASFLIDVADSEGGLVVLSAAPSSQNPGKYLVTSPGAYDKSDDFLPGSKDDLLDLYPNLFAANEVGVQSFDDSLTGSALLNSQTAAEGNGAVLLAGFNASPSYGYPLMVFGRGLTEVISYVVPTASSGVVTSIEFEQQFPNPSIGRGYGLFAVSPDDTPDHTGWVVIVNGTENANPCRGSTEHYSTVRVYRVAIPSDPPQEDPQPPMLLGSYTPAPPICNSPSGTEAGAMFGCYVDMLGGNQFMTYVTYGPRGPETTAGLVVLKGEFVAGDTPNHDKVTLSPITPNTTVPIFSGSDDANVGRVMGEYGKLYAAFGCHGIAVLTPGGWGELPTIDATWTDSTSNPKRVALQARRIVGGSGSSVLLMVSFLNGGIGVFDPDSLAYLGEVTTPWQPNAMVTAGGATPPAVPTIYLADGSGGVHRIEVTPP